MTSRSPGNSSGRISSDQARQDSLAEMFFNPSSSDAKVVNEEVHGVIGIVASYDDNNPTSERFARQNTLEKTIRVFAHESEQMPKAAQENVHLMLANNGMSGSQVQAAVGVVESINAERAQRRQAPMNLQVVDAPKVPGDPSTCTAAYSRNHAFKWVSQLRADNPSMGAPVWIGDDDSITTGMGAMYRVLTETPQVGAVAPRNHATGDVISEADRALSGASNGPGSGGGSTLLRNFPGIWDASGNINFCILTAFGGTRVPKTCSLMLKGGAIRAIQRSDGGVFLVCPEGSFEDMLLSGALQKRGFGLVECPDAHVFDQVRTQDSARALQQFRWAFDHATAFHDLVMVERATNTQVLFNGVSVLSPAQEGWMLQSIPESQFPFHPTRGGGGGGGGALRAAIVNPGEVRALLRTIVNGLENEPEEFQAQYSFAFSGRAGSFRCLKVAQQTVNSCLRLLDLTEKCRNGGASVPVGVPVVSVTEIPAADQLRFQDPVRVARMLGNLAAMAAMSSNDIEAGTIRVALLGPRQPTL